MNNHIRIAGLISLVALCFLLVACKGDQFVGTWKPAPSGDKDAMRIDSFNFNKDGTFSLKFTEAARKEIKGTYAKVGDKGDKIELTNPEMKSKLEATIESDGRMKVSEGGRDPVYFVKS